MLKACLTPNKNPYKVGFSGENPTLAFFLVMCYHINNASNRDKSAKSNYNIDDSYSKLILREMLLINGDSIKLDTKIVAKKYN